jgi:hypothetical protein
MVKKVKTFTSQIMQNVCVIGGEKWCILDKNLAHWIHGYSDNQDPRGFQVSGQLTVNLNQLWRSSILNIHTLIKNTKYLIWN